MDTLKVPLMPRRSEAELSLSQKLKGRNFGAVSRTTMTNIPLLPGSDIPSINTIEEETKNKVLKFYTDSAELKRFNTTKKTKLHKVFTCFQKIPAISPDNQYLIGWKILMMVVVILFFLELPAYIFFGPELYSFISQGQINAIGGISLTLFLVDVLLEFQTAYFRHGNPVTKKSKIAFHYLKSYFLLDMIANLSFGLRLFSLLTDYRWVYLLFYAKLPSFFNSDEHLQEILLLHRLYRLIYKVLRIFVLLFTCINFFCCVFYRIGEYSVANGMNSWLLNNGNFGVIYNMEVHMRYFFSFYFSLGTLSSTMGYGDISPLNPYECTWALLGMMFGIIVFVFNMSLFYDIVQEYQDLYRTLLRDKIAIHRFMHDKNISQTTKSRINQYLVEFWSKEGKREFQVEQRVLDWLGPELKQQLLLEAYGPFIRSIPSLERFSPGVLRELAIRSGELRLSKGEKIIRDKQQRSKHQSGVTHGFDELGPDETNVAQITTQAKLWLDEDNVYFIKSGCVIVHPNIENKPIVLEKLGQGCTFGEFSFFTGFPRESSVTASSYAHLYYVSRKDFLGILAHYPKDYEIYCMLRDQMLLNKNVDQRQNPICITPVCYTCKQLGHIATTCNITHYKPNPLQLEMAQTQQTQQRKKIKRRNKRKKFRTLVEHGNVDHAANRVTDNPMVKSQVVRFAPIQEVPQDDDIPRRVSTRRQSSMLMVQSLSHQGAGELLFDEIDEPKDFDSYFPNNNLSQLIDTYNTLISHDLFASSVGISNPRITMAIN